MKLPSNPKFQRILQLNLAKLAEHLSVDPNTAVSAVEYEGQSIDDPSVSVFLRRWGFEIVGEFFNTCDYEPAFPYKGDDSLPLFYPWQLRAKNDGLWYHCYDRDCLVDYRIEN
jgi:hypothetical protein